MIALCAVFCSLTKNEPINDKVGLYFDVDPSKMNALVTTLGNDREVVIFDDIEDMKQSVTDADIALGYAVSANANDYIKLKKDKEIIEVYRLFLFFVKKK